MSIGDQIRNQVTVRFADATKEPVEAWCQANSARNAFDKKVLEYPATKILAAQNGHVINYLPVQQTIMLESIGPNPEATALEIANGVIDCVKAAYTLAYGAGFREMYFLASDETTAKLAVLWGFEEVPFKLYRRRM